MVDVYRCLTRARLPWSLRDSGRVVGHRDALALRDVEFRVSTPGAPASGPAASARSSPTPGASSSNPKRSRQARSGSASTPTDRPPSP